MRHSASRRRRLLTGILATAAAVAAGDDRADLAGPADPARFASFDALKRHHQRQAFDATADYLARRPEAPDASAAARFLFEMATAEGLTAEARPAAERFLKDSPQTSPETDSLARRVLLSALALEGKTDLALDVLGEELSAVRRANPAAAVDAAAAFAAAAQRGGKPEAAREGYEKLRRAFFLNPGIELICENRLARLELIGKPAPPIGLDDLDGRPAPDLKAGGRIRLVDFWATNCGPCLEEMPLLRRLAADTQEAGFDVFAVSLDDDAEIVRGFLNRDPLPWPVFLSTADGGVTRAAYKVETIPANFLVGRDGTVLRVDLHGADLRAEVERLTKDRD